MTGFTVDVQRFDKWVSINYKDLQRYCKKYRIEDDILNDSYLNVRDRIIKSGFTETYFKTYILRAIRNLSINEKKKLNGKHFIVLENTNYEFYRDMDRMHTAVFKNDISFQIENKLQVQDEIEKDTMQFREDVMYFSKMLFKYIEERGYNEQDKFIFRCYYLMEGRMTYKKLHAMTGINKNACTKVVQTFKYDIRTNFLNWLKNDTRRSNTGNE